MGTARRCGERTQVYSRVTGYHQPIHKWNHGKREEFKNRKTYNVNNLSKEQKESAA